MDVVPRIVDRARVIAYDNLRAQGVSREAAARGARVSKGWAWQRDKRLQAEADAWRAGQPRTEGPQRHYSVWEIAGLARTAVCQVPGCSEHPAVGVCRMHADGTPVLTG